MGSIIVKGHKRAGGKADDTGIITMVGEE